MSIEYLPALDKIQIGRFSLGMLMNFTYNEDPFISEGFYQNETTSEWIARNLPNEAQANWNKGIADFMPYSLITNSTFERIKVDHALLHTRFSYL